MPLWTASLVFWPQSTLPRLIASHEPSGARGTIRQLKTFAARFLHSTSAAHSTSPESTHLGCRMLASQCHLGQLGESAADLAGERIPQNPCSARHPLHKKISGKISNLVGAGMFFAKNFGFLIHTHTGGCFFQHKKIRDGVYVGMSARGRFSRSRPPSH